MAKAPRRIRIDDGPGDDDFSRVAPGPTPRFEPRGSRLGDFSTAFSDATQRIQNAVKEAAATQAASMRQRSAAEQAIIARIQGLQELRQQNGGLFGGADAASRGTQILGLYSVSQTLGKFAAVVNLFDQIRDRMERAAEIEKEIAKQRAELQKAQQDAIAQQFREKFDNMPLEAQSKALERMSVDQLRMLRGGGQSAGTGAAAGGESGAAAAAGGRLAGALGGAATAAGVVVGGFLAAKVAADKLADAFDSAVKRYAEFAPQTAMAQGRAEVANTMGDLRRAQMLDANLARFVELQSRSEQAIENFRAHLLDMLATRFLPAAEKIVEFMEKYWPLATGIADGLIEGTIDAVMLGRKDLGEVLKAQKKLLGIEEDKKREEQNNGDEWMEEFLGMEIPLGGAPLVQGKKVQPQKVVGVPIFPQKN
ncbi:MAG: hypothetical protein IT428_19815 [Planctomycetaceae bacterium]|nr:hypothetical protein [Planctomycetaceae bacterium]